MPPKDLTVPQDDTFTGGLCLITMDPESNCIRNYLGCRIVATWVSFSL